MQQKPDESLIQYKNRFKAIAKSSTGFDDQELSVLFVANMNSKQESFKTDKFNVISDEKLEDCSKTVKQAFRSASRYRARSTVG